MNKLPEILSIIGLVLIIGLLWLNWADLPAQIPDHFDAVGQPDHWGHKSTLLIIPGVTLFIYILITLLTRLPAVWKQKFPANDPYRARGQAIMLTMLTWLKLEIILTFLYIEWISIQISFGRAAALGIWFLPLMLAIIGTTVGLMIYKLFRLRHQPIQN